MARRRSRFLWRDSRAERQVARLDAQAQAEEATARGVAWTPVRGTQRARKLAHTVWGAAWCANLERYHDYANRLPRGRTYLRSGAVRDLVITEGKIEARVLGSSLYRVTIAIAPVDAQRWRAIAQRVGNDVHSLVEILEGSLSDSIMAVMTSPGIGLFPEPKEIKLSCSCPDWATMCKHVAAVMYGVGTRLDASPELLFVLRRVDPSALVTTAAPATIERRTQGDNTLASEDLEALFGVEIVDELPRPSRPRGRAATQRATGTGSGRRPVKAKATGSSTGERASRSGRTPGRPRGVVRLAIDGAHREMSQHEKHAGGAIAERREITRRELIDMGISASKISGWYDRGVLVGAGRPGVYQWTDDLAARVAELVPKGMAAPRSRKPSGRPSRRR